LAAISRTSRSTVAEFSRTGSKWVSTPRYPSYPSQASFSRWAGQSMAPSRRDVQRARISPGREFSVLHVDMPDVREDPGESRVEVPGVEHVRVERVPVDEERRVVHGAHERQDVVRRRGDVPGPVLDEQGDARRHAGVCGGTERIHDGVVERAAARFLEGEGDQERSAESAGQIEGVRQ